MYLPFYKIIEVFLEMPLHNVIYGNKMA